jgi:hypothetical protein
MHRDNHPQKPVVTASALALVLSACGGGGRPARSPASGRMQRPALVAVGGVSAAGQSTTGAIDSFGSVFRQRRQI